MFAARALTSSTGCFLPRARPSRLCCNFDSTHASERGGSSRWIQLFFKNIGARREREHFRSIMRNGQNGFSYPFPCAREVHAKL